MSLQVRIAGSVQDRCAASELVRLAYDVKGPLLSVAARRLASLRRQDAEWWLLEDEGRAVATLLCYPLSFGLPDGTVRPGFGLGAVGTHPEHQRRGHAALLCREVAELNARRDREIGLLFSAINPAYYERLGWRSCQASDFAATGSTKLEGLACSGARAEIIALDPYRSIHELTRLHQERHRGQLHLHRDAEAFSKTLLRNPEDWWLGVGSPDGELRTAVRLAQDGKVLDLIELLGPEQLVAPVLRSLAALALELGCETIICWLPRSEFMTEWFEEKERNRNLPMVLGTPADVDSQFWGSDYF